MRKYQEIEMKERQEVVELLRLKALGKISDKEFKKQKKALADIWTHGSLHL